MSDSKKDRDLHFRLIHELTAYDRRNSKRAGYNRYALPQYFQAAKQVKDAASFAEAFNPTRGMYGIAKRLGFDLSVDRGRWIVGKGKA